MPAAPAHVGRPSGESEHSDDSDCGVPVATHPPPPLDEEEDNEAIIEAEERAAIRQELEEAHRQKNGGHLLLTLTPTLICIILILMTIALTFTLVLILMRKTNPHLPHSHSPPSPSCRTPIALGLLGLAPPHRLHTCNQPAYV